jgi:hypothetical protein
MLKKVVIRTLPLILCSILLLGIASSSMAQVEQVDRIEIPISKDFEIRAMYNFGEDGVLLSTKELRGKSKRDPDRLFHHYDSDLEETESYFVEVPFRQKHSASYETDSSVFILNHDMKFGDFTLIELRAKDLDEKRTEGKLPSKTSIERMFCYSNYAVLYGRTGKRHQQIFVIDLESGGFTIIPLKPESRKMFFNAHDHFVDGPIAYLLLESCSKKKCESYLLYQFGHDGKVTVTNVDPKPHSIVSASISTIGSNEFVIVGTFSNRASLSAEGMFISLYKNGSQQYFKTYPFAEFDKFFDYLTNRQKSRLERVAKRKKARGKSLNFNIHMVLHEVIQLDSEFVVVGEAYYPTYRSETRSSPNGTPITITVFDGFQYSHATLVTFDRNGIKKHDNTFNMYLMNKPYSVKEFIDVGLHGDTVNLIYVDGHFINSKAFKDGEELEQEQWEMMETGNENDRIRGTTSEIQYWYKDYFIAHGFQSIKNRKDKGVNKRRHVFYLQKLRF